MKHLLLFLILLSPTLVFADMQAMLQAAPALKSCSPQVDSSVQIIRGNQNWHTGCREGSDRRSSLRVIVRT